MSISSNTRVGTPTNLNPGGTYDLLLVKTDGAYPEGKLSFSLYNTPMKITGVQKVAQVFLKILLTSKGSDPFNPSYGTVLPGMLPGSNVSDISAQTLAIDIQDAIKDASSQTRAALNVNTADTSSCLDYAEMLGIDVVDQGAVVYVSLVTLDGVSAAISLPFPQFGLD